MREIWENCRAIESEEKGGKVVLRFILNNINNGRAEVTCDQSAEWLPVRIRAGDVRDGNWIVFVDQSTEWEKILRRLVPEPPRQDGLLRERPQTRQGVRSDRPQPAGQRRRQCAGVRLQLERHAHSRRH